MRRYPDWLNGRAEVAPRFASSLATARPGDKFAAQMLHDLTVGLPSLLRYCDRNSMAHSIEARLPFLDHRLVELCISLPPETRIENGVTQGAAAERAARPHPARGSCAPRQDRVRNTRVGVAARPDPGGPVDAVVRGARLRSTAAPRPVAAGARAWRHRSDRRALALREPRAVAAALRGRAARPAGSARSAAACLTAARPLLVVSPDVGLDTIAGERLRKLTAAFDDEGWRLIGITPPARDYLSSHARWPESFVLHRTFALDPWTLGVRLKRRREREHGHADAARRRAAAGVHRRAASRAGRRRRCTASGRTRGPAGFRLPSRAGSRSRGASGRSPCSRRSRRRRRTSPRSRCTGRRDCRGSPTSAIRGRGATGTATTGRRTGAARPRRNARCSATRPPSRRSARRSERSSRSVPAARSSSCRTAFPLERVDAAPRAGRAARARARRHGERALRRSDSDRAGAAQAARARHAGAADALRPARVPPARARPRGGARARAR